MSNSIFDFVRESVSSRVPTLKDIFSKYNWKRVEVSQLFSKLFPPESTLLIDARSEKEFEDSAFPDSINFPVLNNFERHNVGLIYKKYSQSAAIWLAMQYADPKSETLQTFLNDNDAKNKTIVVYCWRGGGRSSYLAKMISDLGYIPEIITGGFKSYRRLVNSFFNFDKIPFKLIELTGLTGTGKSELIRAARDFTNVIDLEKAARHYSSLFGYVPYEIKSFSRVKNQSAFENNIFADIVNGIKSYGNFHEQYLIESESRKIGDFRLPDIIHNELQMCPCIIVKSSMEARVKRIVKDYFGKNNEGVEPMLKILTKSERYFRAKLSNSIYEDCLEALKKYNTNLFSVLMIEKYYDVRYKRKDKKPVAEITNENLRDGSNELKEVMFKFDKHKSS